MQSQKYMIGIGNPIVDISAPTDEESIEKFGLKFGQTIFADESNMGIYDLIESHPDVSYIPGGSITNSIRVTNVSFFTNYSGCLKETKTTDA